MRGVPGALSIAFFVVAMSVVGRAHADPDVAACVQAFDQGQEARGQQALKSAIEHLLVCTRPTCPAVLRADCANVLAEVEAAIPTVVLAADDAHGHDFTEVRVLEGDSVVAEHLEGKPMRVDPGPHRFRFERLGHAAIVEAVVGAGEKNRRVRASFPDLFVEPPPPKRAPGGYVAPIGLAILGATSFAIAGSMRLAYDRKVDDMRNTCAPFCSAADRDDLSNRVVRTNAAIGFGAVMLVAAGVTWFAMAPRGP